MEIHRGGSGRGQTRDPFEWAARNPRKVAVWGVVVLLVGWLLLKGPFFTVEPDEKGLVLTFGRHTRTVGPGFHYKWPWPIQEVRTPRVSEMKRIEIGFRSIAGGYRDFTEDRSLLAEAQMLTGDENIVNLDMVVQYQIQDAADWEFNVKDPVETLRDASEASVRQVVGDHLIDEVITVGKQEIQEEVEELVQTLADRYGLGVEIVSVEIQDAQAPREVKQAFDEVATAREQKNTYINQAEAYRNQRIPQAEGEVERIVNGAEARKAERVEQARGEAERFLALAEEYAKAPGVTGERLLLETLEEVLPRVEKIVIDDGVNVIHLNRLGEILK